MSVVRVFFQKALAMVMLYLWPPDPMEQVNGDTYPRIALARVKRGWWVV